MKRIRLALLLILPLVMLSLAGCASKTYFYNFDEEGDLSRSDGEWFTSNSSYSFHNGLNMNDCFAATPHYYIGDFDLTVTFGINDGSFDYGILEIYLCTDINPFSSDWYGGVQITGVNTLNAALNVYYNDSGLFKYIDENIPVDDELDIGEINTIKLIKRGSSLRFLINGIKVGSTMEIIGNTTDFNIPHIYSGWYGFDPPVTFKSVEIKYWGDQFLVN